MMLRLYLSRTPHFYSDWLWPYCEWGSELNLPVDTGTVPGSARTDWSLPPAAYSAALAGKYFRSEPPFAP